MHLLRLAYDLGCMSELPEWYICCIHADRYNYPMFMPLEDTFYASSNDSAVAISGSDVVFEGASSVVYQILRACRGIKPAVYCTA